MDELLSVQYSHTLSIFVYLLAGCFQQQQDLLRDRCGVCPAYTEGGHCQVRSQNIVADCRVHSGIGNQLLESGGQICEGGTWEGDGGGAPGEAVQCILGWGLAVKRVVLPHPGVSCAMCLQGIG